MACRWKTCWDREREETCVDRCMGREREGKSTNQVRYISNQIYMIFMVLINLIKQGLQRTLLHWSMGEQHEDSSRVRFEENGGI